jgi:hypothetical protein
MQLFSIVWCRRRMADIKQMNYFQYLIILIRKMDHVIMHNIKRNALVFLLFTIFSSCSKKDSGNSTPKPCDFATNVVVTSSDVPVTYNASNSNNASIATLIYQGATGPVTVNNPKLPWTVTIQVPKGDTVNISAVGTASGGSLSLSYLINYSNPNSNSAACGN